MKKVMKKEQIIKILSIIQWVVGIFTIIGYIFIFTDVVNDIQPLRVVLPWLFIGITGIKKLQKQQLVKLCRSTLLDLKRQRDHGEIDNNDYKIHSQKIGSILYVRKYE